MAWGRLYDFCDCLGLMNETVIRAECHLRGDSRGLSDRPDQAEIGLTERHGPGVTGARVTEYTMTSS
jgi:hypothetical protein